MHAIERVTVTDCEIINRGNVDANPGEITHLLAEWRAGTPGALEALTPLIYDELKMMAAAYMRREPSSHTLQPTALVHEAYLRLAGNDGTAWDNRAHFYGIAARLMRQVLVDHARKHLTKKRGDGLRPVLLTEAVASASSNAAEFIAVNTALDELLKLDERKARAVELRYFGGLNIEETAAALQVSTMTIQRDLRFAEAWMLGQLGGQQS
jgi:RNA polymerase sigma-70 factor (ECF subfamily)